MRQYIIFLIVSIGLTVSGWSQITDAEYFIDTDPGVGNGTDLAITSGNAINTNFNIPTTDLNLGLHMLHIRVKGTDDVWSLYYRDYFYIETLSSFESTPITAAEYFFDTDPGVGNGNALGVSEGYTVDENFSIPIPEEMEDGNHVLYIRVKNTAGNWSTYALAPFNVDSNMAVEQVDDDNFSVYPNPVNRFLNIQTKTGADYSYSLVDVNGKKLKVTKTSGTMHKIDFSDYAKGVYFLHLMDQKRGKKLIVKVVKY